MVKEMKRAKTFLKLGLVSCLSLALSACADPTGEVGNTKVGASSSVTPANGINGAGPTAGLVINCPTTATVGGTATCGSTLSGTFVSLAWMVNAVQQASSNTATYTWASISTAGTYRIQLSGRTAAGATISSNTIDVVVSDTPVSGANPVLTIACPMTATVGMNATCTASSSAPLASGYWTVNGTKQEGSDNVYSFTWINIASAGTFKIQGVGYTATGLMVKSNEISVVVTSATMTPPAATLTIVCPAKIAAGGSGTCGSISNSTLVSFYWTVNGVKQSGSDGLTMYTWSNIPVGTYKVQAIAQTLAGAIVKSGEFLVDVAAPLPLSITCPPTVYVGDSAICTATATIALASGFWTLDGVKIQGSDNLLTLNSGVLTAANIGLFSVQGVGFDAHGTKYLSNPAMVRVLAR